MEYTIPGLLADLQRLGYPIEKRRLVDWVQKGLLPRPVHRGLGRGKGSTYYWTQPDILSQVVTIYDLLDWYGRVNGIYLPLWLLGYEVPPEIVRRKLLDHFGPELPDGEQTGADGQQAERLGEVTDAPAAKRQRSRTNATASSDEAATLLQRAFLDPDFEPDEAAVQRAVEALATANAAHPVVDWEPMVRKGIDFVRSHFSVPRLRDAVTNATDADLKRVHSDLRILGNALRELGELVPLPPLGARKYNATANLGPLIVAVDLSLRQAGLGNKVDWLLRWATIYSHRLRRNQKLREALRTGRYVSMTGSEETVLGLQEDTTGTD